ncbi:MAG: UDP-N-acetylmuramoyl-tripeptide--D-alanyl-D-alanine ligase, partial [Gammaproteobacteria bacterium]|nr:UDP-N-acetylmuramoyl-tripeptide--D-alanyl-D-alanine ligase [Gammaproteobacteria bacterium]
MKLNLVEIAEITKGQLYGDDVSVDGLSTDTRNMQAGVLFIALVGDSYDPHEMIEAGNASKAAAVLVQQKVNTTIP